MKINRIGAVGIIALLAVAGPLIGVFASQASSPKVHFESSIVGSSPHTPIDGIASGGVPWVVTAGEAGLTPSGMLQVSIVGLVISLPGSPLDGTTGPVKSVFASLLCQGTSSGSVVVASSGAVPLSSDGNAHISQSITLPSTCAGPIILIRIYATTSGVLPSPEPYIASTGFIS
jgi:hypothetical protein